MNAETYVKLKAGLIEALGIWWMELAVDTSLPTVGADVIEIMATAALQPLRAVADAQEYLAENDLLKEE